MERAINPTLMQTAITYKGVKFPRSRLMYSRDEINVGEYLEVDLASSPYSAANVAPSALVRGSQLRLSIPFL